MRPCTFAILAALFTTTCADAQECSTCNTGGVVYASGYGGGGYTDYSGGGMVSGGGLHGEMFPFDQQDPWIHGYFQRAPSYGGYAAFRPYNYRHVASQQQIAVNWGATQGMNYSQQFWNKYRGAYMNENLHAAAGPVPTTQQRATPWVMPASSGVAYPPAHPATTVTRPAAPAVPQQSVPARPLHLFPSHIQPR